MEAEHVEELVLVRAPGAGNGSARNGTRENGTAKNGTTEPGAGV